MAREEPRAIYLLDPTTIAYFEEHFGEEIVVQTDSGRVLRLREQTTHGRPGPQKPQQSTTIKRGDLPSE